MKLEIDENVFWLSLWTSLALCGVAIFIVVGVLANNKNKIILEAIKTGADPL